MTDISLSLIIAQLINVGLLFTIFYYAIGRRLSHIIEERRELMRKLATIDTEYAIKMQEAEEAKKGFLRQAHIDAQDHMRDVEHIARLKSEEIIKNAHDQAIQILEGGRREIEKEKKTMYAELKERIFDISIGINKKMFGESKIDKEFIEKELKDLE